MDPSSIILSSARTKKKTISFGLVLIKRGKHFNDPIHLVSPTWMAYDLKDSCYPFHLIGGLQMVILEMQ